MSDAVLTFAVFPLCVFAIVLLGGILFKRITEVEDVQGNEKTEGDKETKRR